VDVAKLAALLCTSIVLLCGCESKGGEDSGLSASEEDLADVSAYKSASPFAERLPQCIRAQSSSEACTLAELPLLGMEAETLTVDLIMDRVVTSHDWMGERFEEVLLTLPDDILQLFRGTTAVVIDDDIRPAYYTVSTGAIYLDANFFWLSEAEAASVNPKEDPRSDFDDPLAFRSLWRYVLDNESPYRYRRPDNYVARTLDDIRLLVASLLLHELAHANDFFPPALTSSLDPSMRPWPAASEREASWVSTRLANSNPLGSDTLHGLARVMFHGDTPSADQRDISAIEVGAAYSPDGAADDYAYSSIREDVAMLFEEAMMYRLFGIDRDQAFTSAPGESNFCEDYVIGWGVRNRFMEAQVVPRVEFVLEEILPEQDFSDFIRDLASPIPLQNDVDWCESLDILAGDATKTKTGAALEGHIGPLYR
jgi:hypothetical protein